MNDNRRAIFMLHHQGDFDTPPFITRVTINEDTRHMDEEKNDPFVELVFRDDVLIQTKAYHHPSLKYLPDCSAQTGEGVHRTLAVLRTELDRMSSKYAAAAASSGGAGPNKKAGALSKKRIPPDLFTLHSSPTALGAVANLKNLGTGTHGIPSGPHHATTLTNGSHSGAEKKGGGAKKAAKTKEGEEEGKDSSKGQQRAQCSNIAAGGCNIQ